GRVVMRLRFRSGDRLVYKPQSLAIEEHYQQLQSWVNHHSPTLSLRLLRVLDRGTHGWTEYVQFEECSTAEEVRSFYQRTGALLAIFYSLNATDLHFENLIACRDYPVPIDLETLFHPPLP